MKILIVENNKDHFICLDENKYEVIRVDSGYKAMLLIDLYKFDVVFLDLVLSDIYGIELCKKITALKRTDIRPFVILFSEIPRNSCIEKGIASGAIDCIGRTYDCKKLEYKLNGIEMLLYEENQSNELVYKELKVNTESYRVYENENEIFLTKTEYNILIYMLKNQSRLINREELSSEIWGEEYDMELSDRNINIMIFKLKNKVQIIKENLETIRGIGYRMAKE